MYGWCRACGAEPVGQWREAASPGAFAYYQDVPSTITLCGDDHPIGACGAHVFFSPIYGMK